MSEARRYYGKYRGVVVSAIDPERRGRLQAIVADVTGDFPSTWALPCVPYAEPSHGALALPQPGASVWIEYEYGDPDRPIWSGCFWDEAQPLPPAASSIPPGTRGLALAVDGSTLVLRADRSGDGGVALETEGGAKIRVHQEGLVLENAGAKVTLDGAGVTVEKERGEITLKVGATTLKVSESGITLECGASKVELSAAQLDLNRGSLTVT
ncbi:MAG: phage baseplate assembly protein V [Nannocystaceae bacterium]